MNPPKTCAVLFAREDSIYKSFAECDVFDIQRDAKTYSSGLPIIAHPPCRAWANLAHFAKPREGERDLALWAVDMVRMNGGILEHPATSKLWREKPLPPPGKTDEYGGFSFPVLQWWFGHKAQKATLLYIVGILPSGIPEIPFRIGYPTHMVSGDFRKTGVAGLSQKQREATPNAFAEWLIKIAIACKKEARS